MSAPSVRQSPTELPPAPRGVRRKGGTLSVIAGTGFIIVFILVIVAAPFAKNASWRVGESRGQDDRDLMVLSWCSVLACLVAAVFFLLSARKRQLVRSGTPAFGEVIRRRIARGRIDSYYISYRFVASDGVTYEREISVRFATYDWFIEGTQLTVLYDLKFPSRSLAYECCDYEVVPPKD